MANNAVRDEELAQEILAFLKQGPRKTYEVAKRFSLSFAEARVELDRLENRGRIVRLQELGEEYPSWLFTQGF